LCKINRKTTTTIQAEDETYHGGISLQKAESAFVVIVFPALELVKMLNRPAKSPVWKPK
jgi:hypothetical protein